MSPQLILEHDDILRLRKKTAEMVEYFERQISASDVQLREHNSSMAAAFSAILLRYDEMLATIEERMAQEKRT